MNPSQCINGRRAESAMGHLRPTNSTQVPAIVRYAPLATKMVRRCERSDVHGVPPE
jgi:hypothetical protein